MKKTYWILSILLILLNNLFAQDYISYHNLVNEAEYWMYKKEYKNAKILYKKAFCLEEPMWKDAYLLAKAYVFLNKKKKALCWLKKSSEANVSFCSWYLEKEKEQKDFKSIFNSSNDMKAFIKELRTIEDDPSKKSNQQVYLNIQKQVDELLKRDQAIREECRKSGFTKECKERIDLEDSIIQEKLLAITKEYGFPGSNLIGSDLVTIILVHFDKKRFISSLDILLSEVKNGNLMPFYYGYMLDRFYWKYIEDKNDNPCYLSLLYTKKKCTEEDYDEVIKRRLELGISLFFDGSRFRIRTHELLPWVNEEFIEKYSFLKKNK
ncbi:MULTISPECIES: hypothetical protein [unclassified Aureispira]|uniref:hypothetical protein n=1 Tax=unclassified Aureispira TaxID=2649989 RepID=UPI000697B457|nr:MULTISPECIES: hypothetical protein [unclassified Aureispira]WMX14514.1 hypothetical protein QP953_27025 [Aureispira sp. CCB-E]